LKRERTHGRSVFAEGLALDVGTGAYSTFPYLLASMFGVDVVAIDIDETFSRQRQIRDRASRSDICEADQVRLVRVARARQRTDGRSQGPAGG
jgi:23S rRNA A1618 N6-methylase RlmF